MKRKLTGSATGSIILFLASSMLASVLGIRQVDRMSLEDAWVASADLKIGQIIIPRFLDQQKIKPQEGQAMADPRALIGKRLTVDKKAGESFDPQDVIPVQTPTLAQVVPEGRVLYTLTPDPSGIPVAQLRGGDRLDVLVSNRFGVTSVAKDVRLIGVMRPSRGAAASSDKGVMSLLEQNRPAAAGGSGVTSLVVAVYPEDIYPLARIGSKDKVTLVLHGARDMADGEPLTVKPVQTHREIEMVQGLTRKTIRVKI